MGASCASLESGKGDAAGAASKQDDFSGGAGFAASMRLACYSGPFRVSGLNNSSFESEYTVGRGSGKVLKVRNKITMQQCSAYRLSKLQCPCNDGVEILGLIQKLQSVQHPNICRLFEAFDDPAFIYLIYQELPGGTLLDHIAKVKHMSERRAAEIAWQLVRAVTAGANADVVHGALTPDYILLDAEEKVVVTNMGLIDALKPDPVHDLNKEHLSYVAPEMLLPWYKKQKEQVKDSPKKKKQKLVPLSMAEHAQVQKSSSCDVWSIGVILFQLLSGKLPFKGRGLFELADSIINTEPDYQKRLSKVSPEAWDFLESLLAKDREKRPWPEELLNNSWLSELNRGKLSDNMVNKDLVQSLTSVHAESRFKKMMMKMIAEKLPPRKLKELENDFNTLDTTGDGYVELSELKAFIERHPDFIGNCKDVEEVFAELDEDGGGHISLAEFITATLDTQHCIMESALWDAFTVLDTNKDGKLTKKELRCIVKEMGSGGRLGAELHEELAKIVDTEVHSALTFEEFTALVREEGGRRKRHVMGSCVTGCRSCGGVAIAAAVGNGCKACIASSV